MINTILITGATDGLGKQVAMDLAKEGNELILHGRDHEKGKRLISEIEDISAGCKVHYYNADFASLREINALAETIIKNHSRLDVLINNAGLGVEYERRESADGLEMIFQVDYLSTYILSKKLLPLLKKSAPARIVNVASAGQAPVDFSDPLLEKHWDGTQAYCQAKLSQITLSFAMAEEVDGNLVTINALHPASMMPTKIVTHMFTPQSAISDGVEAVIKLATSDELKAVSGKYFFQTIEARANAQAYNPVAREALLKLSKDLTGVS